MTTETNNHGTTQEHTYQGGRTYETQQEGTVEATTTTQRASTGSGKSRIVIVVVGVIALGLLLILGAKFTHRSAGTGSQSQVGTAPQVKNIPGSSNDSRYNNLQQDVNQKNSADALKTRGTFVPVPTGNSDNGTKDPYDALNDQAPSPDKSQAQKPQLPVVNTTPVQQPVYHPPVQQQNQQASQEQKDAEKQYADQMGVFMSAWSYKKDSVYTEFDTTGKAPTTSTNNSSSDTSSSHEEVAQTGTNASGQSYAPKLPVVKGAYDNSGKASSGSVASATGESVSQGTGVPASTSGTASTTNATASASDSTQKGATFVHAGVIVPVDIVTPVNSDYPGPVRAIVTDGPLKGSIILAEPARVNDTLTFKAGTISIPGQPHSFSINAVMTDASDAAPYMSTYVNHHTFKRYTLLSLAALASGYGEAVTRENSTVTQNPLGGTSVTYGSVDNKQIIGTAVGNLGQTVAEDLQQGARQPPTVKLEGKKGEPFNYPAGLLFLTDF